jgi:hypothetical protein
MIKTILRICHLGLLLIYSAPFFSQKFTISGTITDSIKGEAIINATIRLKGQPIGTLSNEYGFYSITLPKEKYVLSIIATGYKPKEIEVILDTNKLLDLTMQSLANEVKQIREITIKAKRPDQNVMDPLMGVERITPQAISKIPILLGEKDIIKTLQLLPGVKSAGEGNAGFYVRGGAADQNLILLDEATVYNAAHLLGFFSTFNSDVIKDAVLYKGNQPANYGGRLSSVLDIKMNDGNNKHYNASGGIGLIASRLNVEGPIVKDKSSFLISGRRTYIDLFLRASETFKQNTLFFYDLNTKLNYKINPKNRIYLSGYFGRDKLGLGDQFGIDWGNATGTIRWNHILNDKLFSNTSLIFSSYDYKIAINNADVQFDITSSIKDINLKQEFQYYINTRNKLKFGLNAMNHRIIPGQIDASAGSGINPLRLTNNKSLEVAAFITNDFSLSEKLNLSYGVRLSTFSLLGNNTNIYSYFANGDVRDTIVYPNNALIKTYTLPEPRLSFSYVYSKTASFKAAYARNAQFIHLISNTTTTAPTDLWIPSSLNTKPEIADMVSVGWFKNFRDNMFEMSVETYYKTMQNQIDYRNGANLQANDLIEGELLYGIGRAYGVEFVLKKSSGKLSGWVGYTLSRTERKINGINNGLWYAAKQDRTHDISIVTMYDITPKLAVSALFVYYTGNAVTFPSGKYSINGQTQFLYTERNGYRMPAYHRLDLGVTWIRKQTEKYESSWNFSIYNAYGRENAFTIDFRQNKDNPDVTEAVQTSLFRWVPAITYNFKIK